MARCGVRNGSLYVKTRRRGSAARRSFYGCTSFHLRGKAACSNGLELPMELADRAVLDALERDILRPEVVEAAIARAAAQLNPSPAAVEQAVETFQEELRTIDRELGRLTAAIATGGELSTLLTGVQDRERRRTMVRAELERLSRPAVDVGRLTADLRARLDDWRGLLTRHVPQARQILRKLLTSAVVFTPSTQAAPHRYAFRFEASPQKLLGSNMVASPCTCWSGPVPTFAWSSGESRRGPP